MWVMLTEKLPTKISPPKMSIHWTEEWPGDADYLYRLWKRLISGDVETIPDFNRSKLMETFGVVSPKRMISKLCFSENKDKIIKHMSQYKSMCEFDGMMPNWFAAKSIYYEKEKIRIFPHEFTRISNNHFQIYINEKAIIFHESDVISQLNNEVLSKTQKEVYDAACVDGCNEYQARMVALGKDPFNAVFPPVGWFEFKKEIAEAFCTDRESQIN